MNAFLLLALAAGASAADPAACSKGFTPELAAEWETTQASWNSLCAKGYDAGDVLREVQRASVARCTGKFLPYEKTGKVPVGQAQAFCARGSSGRAELATSAGLPPDRPPAPPKPRVPPRKPGSAGMGPVGLGLSKAREAWRPDACLSGMRYYFRVLGISDCEEVRAAALEHRSERVTDRLGFDKYSYFYSSPGSERDIYRVTYTDAHRSCPDAIYTKGPEHENLADTAALSTCLQGVTVDAGQAFDIAEKNGWKATENVVGWLGVFPTAFFARTCGRTTLAMGGPPWMGDYSVQCGDGRWDAAKLRRATGTPTWVLTSDDQTAFVDAVTGRFRYLGAGNFCLDLPPSYLNATFADGDARCPH